MGWIVLGHLLSARQVAGGLIVVMGIVLLTYPKSPRPAANAQVA